MIRRSAPSRTLQKRQTRGAIVATLEQDPAKRVSGCRIVAIERPGPTGKGNGEAMVSDFRVCPGEVVENRRVIVTDPGTKPLVDFDRARPVGLAHASRTKENLAGNVSRILPDEQRQHVVCRRLLARTLQRLDQPQRGLFVEGEICSAAILLGGGAEITGDAKRVPHQQVDLRRAWIGGLQPARSGERIGMGSAREQRGDEPQLERPVTRAGRGSTLKRGELAVGKPCDRAASLGKRSGGARKVHRRGIGLTEP